MKRQTFDDEDDDDFYDDVNAKMGSPTQSCFTPDRKKRRGMIEKKRRDRINQCLSELKRLVPSAFEKQGSAKLEKAEILKMTVDHLKLLQTNQKVNSSIPEHSILASDLKREGYRECVSEVARYMMTFEGLDPQNPLLVRLLNHLYQLQNSHQLHPSLTISSVKSQPPINNTSAFSQVSQRLDYWSPPTTTTSRRHFDSRNPPNASKPLHSNSLMTPYFPATSSILSYGGHHHYYGNYGNVAMTTEEGRTSNDSKSENPHSYLGSSLSDGNSQQNERKESGAFNFFTGVLNPNDPGRPGATATSTFDNSNFTHSTSQLLHYLKPYRPWGTELALY